MINNRKKRGIIMVLFFLASCWAKNIKNCALDTVAKHKLLSFGVLDDTKILLLTLTIYVSL